MSRMHLPVMKQYAALTMTCCGNFVNDRHVAPTPAAVTCKQCYQHIDGYKAACPTAFGLAVERLERSAARAKDAHLRAQRAWDMAEREVLEFISESQREAVASARQRELES